MGKKQHQKDKLYLTTVEWVDFYGGKRSTADIEAAGQLRFRRLPFDHCALSFQPWEDAVCDAEGHIFELTALVPYVKKHKRNPVTGNPMDVKQITPLKFYRNPETNALECPVLRKQFTDHSHVIANKVSGNVYSYEAVEQLNLKPRNFHDLISDEAFTRTDLITLQEPSQLDKFNISTFYHVRQKQTQLKKDALETTNDDGKPTTSCSSRTIRNVNSETRATLEEWQRNVSRNEGVVLGKAKELLREADGDTRLREASTDELNAAHFSTGAVAASLTSTVMPQSTVHQTARISDEELRYERVKRNSRKGYVRLVTSLGPLNLELHCDLVQKTCENFLLLCKRGYYNNVIFHRKIKYFMAQSGDPTGTGKGGDSAWGGTFADEFRPKLKHDDRGVLSMANSGANTNKSQFFITFRQAKHLDNKHTVFGRLVGGMETLNAIEKVETDDQDRPTEDIKIFNTAIFVDPFEEADEQLATERETLKKQREQEEKLRLSANKKPDEDRLVVQRSGVSVGKYIKLKREENQSTSEENVNIKKKKVNSSSNNQLQNFSNW